MAIMRLFPMLLFKHINALFQHLNPSADRGIVRIMVSQLLHELQHIMSQLFLADGDVMGQHIQETLFRGTQTYHLHQTIVLKVDVLVEERVAQLVQGLYLIVLLVNDFKRDFAVGDDLLYSRDVVEHDSRTKLLVLLGDDIQCFTKV